MNYICTVKRLFVGLALAMVFSLNLPTMAFAQQVAIDAQIQALGKKLYQEMSEGLQCQAAKIEIGQELTKAQAEIKRLTDKYEPPKAQ